MNVMKNLNYYFNHTLFTIVLVEHVALKVKSTDVCLPTANLCTFKSNKLAIQSIVNKTKLEIFFTNLG